VILPTAPTGVCANLMKAVSWVEVMMSNKRDEAVRQTISQSVRQRFVTVVFVNVCQKMRTS
jgi:hypothetical protein